MKRHRALGVDSELSIRNIQYYSKVDDLYSKRRPDGFAGKPRFENPEICRIGAPHQPPFSYPPRPPRPSDSEKFESRGCRTPENRVRWVVGVHTCENGESAGETSHLANPIISFFLQSVFRYSWKVDDLYRKRRPDGFAGEPKLKIPEICRTGAPPSAPQFVPPETPQTTRL